MNLPNKFKFKIAGPYTDNYVEYDATWMPDTNHYKVSWQDDQLSFAYTLFYMTKAEYLIKEGRWIMIKELVENKCNGIDINGNPLDFTHSMFRPYQIVETRDGEVWMVNNYIDIDSINLVKLGGGVMRGRLSITDEYSSTYKDSIIKVWECPHPSDIFRFDVSQGPLIWEETPKVQQPEPVELTAKQIAMDNLKKAIDSATETLLFMQQND